MSTNDRDRIHTSSVAKFFDNIYEIAEGTIWFWGALLSPGANVFKRLGAKLAGRKAAARPAGEHRVRNPWPVPLARDGRASCWEVEREVCTVRVQWRRELGVGEPLMMERPEDVHAVATAIYAGLDGSQEHFLLLGLNAHHALIGYQVIASGSPSAVNVDVGVFYRSALLLGAVRAVAVHNHPSGVALPSENDYLLTRKLVRAGSTLGVELAEHLIYTPHSWLSLKELHAAMFAMPAV